MPPPITGQIFLSLGHYLNREKAFPDYEIASAISLFAKDNWGLITTAVRVWFCMSLIGKFGPIKFSFWLAILNTAQTARGDFARPCLLLCPIRAVVNR